MNIKIIKDPPTASTFGISSLFPSFLLLYIYIEPNNQKNNPSLNFSFSLKNGIFVSNFCLASNLLRLYFSNRTRTFANMRLTDVYKQQSVHPLFRPPYTLLLSSFHLRCRKFNAVRGLLCFSFEIRRLDFVGHKSQGPSHGRCPGTGSVQGYQGCYDCKDV